LLLGNAIGISVWSSVTSIPYDQAVEASKQHQESLATIEEVDDAILVSELVQAHTQPRLPPIPSATSFSDVQVFGIDSYRSLIKPLMLTQNEHDLVQKALQLFETVDPNNRKGQLVQGTFTDPRYCIHENKNKQPTSDIQRGEHTTTTTPRRE